MKDDVMRAIQYNIDNFGCIDPLDCSSIDEFMHMYYRNLEDDSEKEGD